MKIKATIRHGGTATNITAKGATIAECMDTLAGVSTYVPFTCESGGNRVLEALEAHGKAALGWVEYEIINT